MTNFFTLLLIAVSLTLGVIIGETYAPISGKTVYALTLRVEALETQVGRLDERCARVEAELKTWGEHLKKLGLLP